MICTKFRNLAIAAALLLACASTVLAQDAKLRLYVRPPQAYIFIDGLAYGEGSWNQVVSLPPGKHTVAVHNYGYIPQEREVSLNPGRNPYVEFVLQKVPGDISGPWGRIQIKGPPHAAVLLNGKTPEFFVGHVDEFDYTGFFCCTQQLVVPAGSHLVTLTYKGKEIWSGQVNVAANQGVIIDASSGEQKVKPWPKGASVGSLPRFEAGIASASIAVASVSGQLAADPGQINCGDSARLTWTTSETVQRVLKSDGESKNVDPTGELSVQPKKPTEYQLEAAGPGGIVTSTAPVNVNTAVQSSIESSPGPLRYRRVGDKVVEQGSTTLTWTTSNASSVKIDPLGSVGTTGSQTILATPKQGGNGPVNEQQTYTLTATNECGGSDTHTVAINVTGLIESASEVPLASVFFPTGYPDVRHPSAGLVESQQKLLAATADGFKKYLEDNPDAKLTVIGNTDVRDSNERNKPLSQRRANRVKDYLSSLGIPESKIETIAQGKEKQLDAATVKSLQESNPNKPPKEPVNFQELVWAYNRRVDIVLQPKGQQSTQYYPGNSADADLLLDSNWPGQKQIVILAAEKTAIPKGE